MTTEFIGPNGERILTCEREVKELCRDFYPEISPREINVFFQISYPGGKTLGAGIRRGEGFLLQEVGYDITGVLPVESLEEGSSSRLAKAILGHEFAHIVNGDLEDLGVFLVIPKMLPLIGNFVTRFVEHRADREAIRRGLGGELVWASRYLDSFDKKRDTRYYSTEQLEKLVADSLAGASK